MDVLDEARFTELSERHRRELQVHSYRMLGNLEQAEDAVQEALLRAWKGRASFDGGPAARAWLYRIVTTTCFDVLRAAKRRPEQIESIADVPWLQPYPDALLDAAAEPEGAAIRRETVELAYLAVIQLLPARQRAVLLLRDVQGYSAAETAQMLGMSVPAVTSALQRARATLQEKAAARDGDWSPDGITGADRALLAAFVDAHQRQDPAAGLAVIREDIRVAMPPNPGLFTGRDAVAGFMAAAYDRSIFGDWKLLPTAANRMPAAASYLRRADSDRYLPFKLDVLRTGGGLIAEITTFDASLFGRFGLPPFLPADDLTYGGNGGGFFPDVGIVFVGIPMAAVECALWLWMAWAAVAGRGWARILSTVFFGIMSLMLVYSIKAFPSPSDVTSTGPFIGTVPLISALPLISTALEWLAGLAALILLWQRASSQFFTASREIGDAAR